MGTEGLDEWHVENGSVNECQQEIPLENFDDCDNMFKLFLTVK